MDQVRYCLGVVGIIVYPLGLLFWLVIHRWAPVWRRLGPARTYLIVLTPLAGLGVLLFQFRGLLLGADLGTNRSLIAIALALCVPMIWLELQYWRRLSIATLVGLPELSPTEPGKLIKDGIYRVVRHPRYLSAGIGVVVNALVINYVGLYVLIFLAIPGPGYLILLLEERELVERFGEEYRQFQREVPRLIPRLR